MICLLLLSALSYERPTLDPDSLREEFRRVARHWVTDAYEEGWLVDSVDAAVLERTVEEFGLFLDERVGIKKREKIFAEVGTPDELSAVLDKELGKRFGALYFEFYSWLEAANPGWTQEWVTRESEHFVYYYYPRSAAEKDIALVAAVAEKSFEDIESVLKPAPGERARLSRIVMTGGTEPYWGKGKIPVRLFPERSYLRGAEEASGGQTGFLPVWFQDTVGYALWIDISYPGPAGLFGIPHEVAHALALLYLSNEPLLFKLFSEDAHMPTDTLRKAVLSDDILRLEGWAYMVQYNYSSYVRLGMWNSSRETLKKMSELYEFPDPYMLLAGEVAQSFSERALDAIGFKKAAQSGQTIRFLFASADLIRFLYEGYGPEKLRAFLTLREGPMDALLKVYELAPYDLQQRWRNDVEGK